MQLVVLRLYEWRIPSDLFLVLAASLVVLSAHLYLYLHLCTALKADRIRCRARRRELVLALGCSRNLDWEVA